MPQGEPDATDPMVLNGVVVATDDQQATREMARSFVEEYLRIGFDPVRIFKLFQAAAYAGPHLAYRMLGETEIRSIIDEQLQRRGRLAARPYPVTKRRANGDIELPVLDT